MLGDLLGEDRGQVIATRVLPSEPGQGPRVEVSFETHGILLGLESHEFGTYQAVARPDGVGVRRRPPSEVERAAGADQGALIDMHLGESVNGITVARRYVLRP